MRYEYTNGENVNFIHLSQHLDAYLNKIAGGNEKRKQYEVYNGLKDIHDVVLVYDDIEPVGCVAFRYYGEKTAEVKRVFVKDSYRGKGISQKLMELLEQKAREKGFKKLILETGAPLVEAMHLYKKLGFGVIANYYPYENMPQSICLEKDLI